MTKILAILLFLCHFLNTTHAESITFLDGPQSYVIYKNLNARERATINFKFKTNSSDGSLMYIPGRAGTTAELTLRLERQKLILKISYSESTDGEEILGGNLDDLLWHNVTIIRNHRATIFELDGAQKIISKIAMKTVLNVKHLVYVGDYPQSGVNAGGGFIGCIGDFKFAQGYEELIKRSPSEEGSNTKRKCLNHCSLELDLHCKNGGRTVNGFNKCICDCFGTKHGGSHCDEASPVISLRSNMDFISRNIESFKRRLFNKVQVMFKTRQKDGIILTTGNNNAFLTLEMYLGRIRLEANAGAGKVVMQSSHELDDGDWHDVQVKQNLASFTLIVDDKRGTQRYEATKQSPYDQVETGCGKQEIAYIGGHYNPITAFGSKSKQGFVGCLQQLHINQEGTIIDDIVEKLLKPNETFFGDYYYDGKLNQGCNVVKRPVPVRKPSTKKKTVKNKGTDVPKLDVMTKGNGGPAASSIQQNDPASGQRTGKKLNKNSVAWITAGIVIGAIVLLLALGFIIHRFKKKYRGSFMAPRDENDVPYYSSVPASYHTHSNGTGRKHRGNATEV